MVPFVALAAFCPSAGFALQVMTTKALPQSRFDYSLHGRLSSTCFVACFQIAEGWQSLVECA
jgi:hypothetical protein